MSIAWKSLGSPVLSNDGQWFGYRLAPQEGDAEILVKAVRGDKTLRFPIGEVPAGGARRRPRRRGRRRDSPRFAFSDDGKWAAFTNYPTRVAAQRLKRQRRPIQSSVTVVNLASGEKKEYPKIRRFAFSGESASWVALHRYGPDAPGGGAGGGAGAAGGGGRGAAGGRAGGGDASERPRGTDLILRDLAKGAELNVGNVSEFSFRKDGKLLALAIDAQDKAGNGLQLRDMATGAVSALDSGSASYERITWSDKGDALAVLKGTEDRAYRDKFYALVGVTDITSATPKKVIFDPAADASVPKGMSISPNRDPPLDRRSPGAAVRPVRAAPEGRRRRNDRRRRRGARVRRREPECRGARRRQCGRESRPGAVALQGSAPADAAGSPGGARPRVQLRRRVPRAVEEVHPAGRRLDAERDGEPQAEPLGLRHRRPRVRADGQPRRPPSRGRVRHRPDDRRAQARGAPPALLLGPVAGRLEASLL